MTIMPCGETPSAGAQARPRACDDRRPRSSACVAFDQHQQLSTDRFDQAQHATASYDLRQTRSRSRPHASAKVGWHVPTLGPLGTVFSERRGAVQPPPDKGEFYASKFRSPIAAETPRQARDPPDAARIWRRSCAPHGAAGIGSSRRGPNTGGCGLFSRNCVDFSKPPATRSCERQPHSR